MHDDGLTVKQVRELEEKRDRLMRLDLERGVAVEKVVKAALLHASDKFNERAEDPGWTAELHEDMLAEAITEAAAAINVYKTAKKEYGL